MALKQNSKKILDIYASQKAKNITKAYKEVHPTAKSITANVNGYKLLKKPDAQLYLDKHINKAKNRIIELVDSNRENIALQASESILDRALGKPVNKTESINLNIDTALQDLL